MIFKILQWAIQDITIPTYHYSFKNTGNIVCVMMY